MKKTLSAIFLIMLIFFSQAANANDFLLTLDSLSAKPGDTVSINLSFSDNTGLIAALFEVEYDKERLSLINAEDKALLKGAVFSKDYSTFPYIMLWNSSSAENFTSDGVLATLTFKVLDNAKGGNAFINVSYDPENVFDAKLNNVTVHINNGSVKVLSDNPSDDELSEDKNENDKTADNEAEDSDNVDDEAFQEEDDKPATESTTHNSSGSSKGKHNTTDSTATKNPDVESVVKESGYRFDDVKETDWYYDDVVFITDRKLMNGISGTLFAPDSLLTRGMLVTILYRNEGEPAINKSIPFKDIDKGAYYENAVSWAKQNSIINGVSENEFAPEQNITREQIAAIIYRYDIYKGKVTVTTEENLHFTDSDDISTYAVSAMNWAVGKGLINGKTATTLNPKDFATRAEIAAILHRFIKAD